MTTFEQARAIVVANRASEYPPEAGFEVADYGWETDEVWVMVAGSHPELHGSTDASDLDYVYNEDGPQITVNKVTGEYVETYGVRSLPEGAVPVGDNPQADDDVYVPGPDDEFVFEGEADYLAELEDE